MVDYDEFSGFNEDATTERDQRELDQDAHDFTERKTPLKFLAKNTSPSNVAFKERIKYLHEAYPYVSGSRPIDVWYNKGLYGKVNPNYSAIITKDEWEIGRLTVPVLKKLPGDDEQLFAMNFVVDAFVDLQEHIYRAANRGDIVTTNSVFLPLTPTRGWTSFPNMYRKYFENLYKGFTDTFLNEKKWYKEVKNFTNFIETFSHFVREILPDFPISSSGYVLSKHYPLVATGLVIELADANHGDDATKYDDYISDPNFLFFIGAAAKFGFRVDKNAPWRLIADIGSATMQDYMKAYPEAPIDPGDPDPLIDPCATSQRLFSEYINQKVEITSSGIAAHGESSLGIITDIYCTAENYISGNSRNAAFVIQGYCPESDIDLLGQEGLRDLSEIAQPQATFTDEVHPDWLTDAGGGTGTPASTSPGATDITGSGDISAAEESAAGILYDFPTPGIMKIIATHSPSIDNDIPVWINTTFADTSGEPVGIEMDKVAPDVHEYIWRIIQAPPTSTQASFYDYNNPMVSLGGGRTSTGYGGPVTVGNTAVNPGVRFMPDVAGVYLLQAQAINLENPQLPRPVGNSVEMMIKYCVFGAEDINSSYLSRSGVFNRAEFFVALVNETKRLWRIRNQRSLDEELRIRQIADDCDPQGLCHPASHYYHEDNVRIHRDQLAPWFMAYLRFLSEHYALGSQIDVSPVTDRLSTPEWTWGTAPATAPPPPLDRFNPDRDRSGIAKGSVSEWGYRPIFHLAEQNNDYTYVLALLSQELRLGKNITFLDSSTGGLFPAIFYEVILNDWDVEGVDTGQDLVNYFINRFDREAQDQNRNLNGINEVFLHNVATQGRQQYPQLYNKGWESEAQILAAMSGHPVFPWQADRMGGWAHSALSEVYKDFVMECKSKSPLGAIWRPPSIGGEQNPAKPCYLAKYLVPIAPQITDDRFPAAAVYTIGASGYYNQFARYDDNLIFTLKTKSNNEMITKRTEYAQAVMRYPELKKVHDERTAAKTIYNQHLDDYNAIHLATNPRFGGPLTFDNVFKRQFEPTMEQDLRLLKDYMVDFYNSYAMARPLYTVPKIKAGGEGTTTCLLKRKMITTDSMETLFPDAYWVEFYYNLRAQESRKDISPAKIKNFKIKVKNILSKVPLGADTTVMTQALKRVVHLINEDTKGVVKEKIS